jgi:signal transduction histidine kinase
MFNFPATNDSSDEVTSSVSPSVPRSSCADILIVDDVLENVQLLSKLLSQAGYSVRKALNGTMALTAAQQRPPHLILLDINMPELNGYQVCQQLKQQPALADVPVIFLSALDDPQDKVRGFEVGGVDYITKPFEQDEVMVRIQHQLTIQALQQQLQEKNQSLELTLERLQEAQVQLIQKEKMLGLGQLIAGITHEVNNPISFIYGNLTPARRYFDQVLALLRLYRQKYPQVDPDIEAAIAEMDLDFILTDWEKLMRSMQTGVERIKSIMVALQLFSHLGESDIKPVDVNQSLDSVLSLLGHRLQIQDVRPEIPVIRQYDQIPLTVCHGKLINQALLNLLNNAIDAIECWGTAALQTKPLSITLQTEALGADQIRIEIKDTGVGISPDIQPRIYEPFFTTKPVGEGTGLGLSTSYQVIVEQHGGQLTCDSVPGEGTTMTIILPVLSSAGPKEKNRG